MAWQLPLPYQSREMQNMTIETSSPEQSCAKEPVEKRDECLRVTGLIARIVGSLRVKGAAYYTSIEKLELMLGPPLGLLVVGVVFALITHRRGNPPPAAMLTVSAIILVIVSFLTATVILTAFGDSGNGRVKRSQATTKAPALSSAGLNGFSDYQPNRHGPFDFQ
jgi:xanthosine utilization system XapX-like protein